MVLNIISFFYKKVISIFLLTLSFSVFSQEICNNAIDDDGDGLIDLNDSIDCVCGIGTLSPIPSVIPNPSFEAMNFCPDGWSELYAAANWVEATSGTTDYLNTCGFTYSASTAGLLPFPDGNAAIGAFYMSNYKEYVGACLLSPLLAGQSYTLKFYIASSLVSPGELSCGSINGLYQPINITLFGAPSCANLPVYTWDCPLVDPAWMALGTVSYTPIQAWNSVTITFTPSVNINTIMFGSPCFLPMSYQLIEPTTDCRPYFYYDNLILNQTSLFQQSISISGIPCTNNTILTANLTTTISSSAVLQWYKDGVAIIGANSYTYNVPSGSVGFGNYQVKLNDGIQCAVTNKYSIISSPPLANFSGINDITIPIGSSLNLINQSTSALNYKWEYCNSAISTNTNISIPLNDTGRCCIKLLAYNYPCIDSISKCITVIPESSLTIPNVFTPNGDNVNEVFKINSYGLKNLNCTIYNRWGIKIYEWDDINGFWDGKTKTGDAVSGTYFYTINYTNSDSELKTEKGFLTLFRD